MSTAHSPLRYPGGKQILARVLGHLIRLNGREGGIYAEPYAGGAGAALTLLYGEHVKRVMINDLDPSIHAFWDAVLNETNGFVELLRKTPLNVDEWQRQREIYRQRRRPSTLKLGFATFYLNRCNRSGIVGNAGPIGGKKQKGKWKIGARFNREDLINRIERVALYRDRIELHNLDAVDFLRDHISQSGTVRRAFVYLDPPYYVKGSSLYLNYGDPAAHEALATYMRKEAKFLWAMTYDNVAKVRRLYAKFRRVRFNLGYSASTYRKGRELMIFGDELVFPDRWHASIPTKYITAADNVMIPVAG